MTDLEITKLCAVAMGLGTVQVFPTGSMKANNTPHTAFGILIPKGQPGHTGKAWTHYDPLHNDAQALALVKRFFLFIDHTAKQDPRNEWYVAVQWEDGPVATGPDLNRAIVECIAQAAAPPETEK